MESPAVVILRTWAERWSVNLEDVFGPPETPESVAAAEELVGSAFPEDYRRFLLELGAARSVPVEGGNHAARQVISGIETLPIVAGREEYLALVDLLESGGMDVTSEGPVRPDYMNRAWWPITLIAGGSDYHCLDLAPAPGGDVGQVIWVGAKYDVRRVVAPSFIAFVAMMIREAGDAPPDLDAGIELGDDAWARFTA